MKKLMMVVAALSLSACQPDTRNIEKKLDELNKKIDNLQARGGVGAANPQQRPQRPEPDRAKTYAVPVDGDPFDGPADAKVTVVKAYDYACPFCDRVRETMDDLRKKYPSDLRVVYKQFVVHPTVATAGALAFCAAAKQGKAMEMDKLLWDKSFKSHNFDKDQGQGHACWDNPEGCSVVLGYAQELGLNADKFKSDMKDCVALAKKDQTELQQLGVGATPSFFINGRFISGAVPIENFTQVIEEELKKANEKISAGTPAAQYYQQWVVDKGQKTLDAPKQ
ncbi:MAG TPA: thioredoxin domain-containing protein [Kofleriaceae bacterium]|nr:thioredoxin domain-containing protein [Kofleriaceae bacterium]